MVTHCTEPKPCVALQAIFQTATAGGRSGGGSRANKSKEGGNSDHGGGSSDSLELLSAKAVLKLLQLADAAQQMDALMHKIPLPQNSTTVQETETSEEAGGANGAHGGANAATNNHSLARAIGPRLQHFKKSCEHLMEHGCFKEAQILGECLLLLGAKSGVAAAKGLSEWAHEMCQQNEPEVTHVPLVKVLLELYVKFSGELSASAAGTPQKLWYNCTGV